MKRTASVPLTSQVLSLQGYQQTRCCAPNARTRVSVSSRVRRRDSMDTEQWRETSSVTSDAQRVAKSLVHAPWRLNTCNAEHNDGLAKCTKARFPA